MLQTASFVMELKFKVVKKFLNFLPELFCQGCLCRNSFNTQSVGPIVDAKNLFHLTYRVRDMHDDVIKWKHFPRYWPFVRGIPRSPVNSPHKGQWRGALMSSLICAWINGWANNGEAGDLRRNHAHYDVTVMLIVMVLIGLLINRWCVLIFQILGLGVKQWTSSHKSFHTLYNIYQTQDW